MRIHPDYYYQQSAVIPYRRIHGELQVMVISSRSRKRWVVPKGVIEPSLSAPESAAKEAMEEAGITGLVHDRMIGSFQYHKWGGECDCQVFVMLVAEVRDTWMESHRYREWLSHTDAAYRMKDESLQEMILSLPDYLHTLQER